MLEAEIHAESTHICRHDGWAVSAMESVRKGS
jgi:hypothetical protein